jgi:hypothetical protein
LGSAVGIAELGRNDRLGISERFQQSIRFLSAWEGNWFERQLATNSKESKAAQSGIGFAGRELSFRTLFERPVTHRFL